MTLSIVHKQYHGQKGQNGQWSSVQKDIKDEMTLSIVHKQYHGQKGQYGQWSIVQKYIKDEKSLSIERQYHGQNDQNSQMVNCSETHKG